MFAGIVEELYADNTTAVMAADGPTNPIRIESGIRQGCSLSGLLFNLVVDTVIRAVQGGNGAQNILAYADDLTPLLTASGPATTHPDGRVPGEPAGPEAEAIEVP